MAMDQIDVAAANLGKFLQKVYSNGVVNQLSEDFRDWEMVTKQKVSDEAARSVDFMVQKSYGVSAVQWARQGGAQFPSSSQTTHEELSAGFNQLYSTVEIQGDLWRRAMGSPHKYADPLAIEIQSKGTAQRRLLSAAFHLDGTGTLATCGAAASTVDTGPTPDTITFDFSGAGGDGGSRYFEYGDVVQLVEQDGTPIDATITYTVIDKDRKANTVEFQVSANGVKINAVNATHGTANGSVTATSYFQRAGTEYVDKTAANFSGAEVNNLTQFMPGLPSLTAADGRVLHGMTMSGVTKGTKFDVEGAIIDISNVQAALDKLKTITGEGTFKYKQLLAAPETLSAFIDSQEADRRLVSLADNKRGQKGFGYIHGNDTLEIATSEYCAAKSLWAIPEGAKQSGVVELHGKDFTEVKAGSQGEFLKVGASGGYEDQIQKFMSAHMTLICKRPNAILEVTNFVTE